MALFVELDDDDVEPPPHDLYGGKPIWKGDGGGSKESQQEAAQESAGRENPNRNSVTAALGCYPIIREIASSIDLNTLDNLSRTCRQVRANLLQNRSVLLASTLRCCNENLPVDADETLRYRARAGNWFYMEEAGRSSYNGKTGQCARDMVSECRRCGTVVCRNCAIKPPAPIVLRERHRRLCVGCTKAPIGSLVKPPTLPTVPLSSDYMQRAICACATEGVWLCQPCGRSIRGADHDYQAIWKWRNQYGEVLGGLGTGIGEGDRGVVCGRADACRSAKGKEQETDCDAEDARSEAEGIAFGTPTSQTASSWLVANNLGGNASSSSSLTTTAATATTTTATQGGGGGGMGDFGGGGGGGGGVTPDGRTPSPALGPGYARHEIEGIGGVVKRKLVRMVRVGACVPEYVDEKARGEILGREVDGRVRSWCGWCWRVIPGKKDYEADRIRNAERRPGPS